MKWLLIVGVFIISSLMAFLFWPVDEKPSLTFVASEGPIFSFETIPLPSTIPPSKEVLPISPLALVKPIIATPSPSVVISENIPTELVDTAVPIKHDFYYFTERLMTHFQQGLSVNDLEALYDLGQQNQWPIEWIFSSVENSEQIPLSEIPSGFPRGLSYTHHFFTLSFELPFLSKSNYSIQKRAFKKLANSCSKCNPMVVHLLKPVEMRTFDFNRGAGNVIGEALLLNYFLQTSETEQLINFTEFYTQNYHSVLTQSENEYLRNHGRLATLLLNKEAVNKQDKLAFLNHGGLSLNSMIELMRNALEFDQAEMYTLVKHKLGTQAIGKDLSKLFDFIIYHGQFYSLSEATSLLNFIQQQHDISDHPVWVSFKRAQQQGFDTLAKKWQAEYSSQVALFEGKVGRGNKALNIEKLLRQFSSNMMSTSDMGKMKQRWSRHFVDQALADQLFAQVNWPAIAWEYQSGNTTFVENSRWNDNIQALNQAGIRHQLDVASFYHHRIMNDEIGTKAKAFKRIINPIYTQLLPPEKAMYDLIVRLAEEKNSEY